MIKLKNLIVGFVDKKSGPFLTNQLEFLPVSNEKWGLYNRTHAISAFNTDLTDSFYSNFIRLIQKNIGGGPSEFIRDIKEMEDDHFLFVLDTADLESSTINKIRDICIDTDLQHIKHFGTYSVEHLSTEPNHDNEMPQISKMSH